MFQEVRPEQQTASEPNLTVFVRCVELEIVSRMQLRTSSNVRQLHTVLSQIIWCQMWIHLYTSWSQLVDHSLCEAKPVQ